MTDQESLAQRRARLSPAKQALLAQWSKAAAPVAASQLAPRAAGSLPPLSWAQERLWFLDQLEPGATAYNLPLALRLVGQLDPDALDRSLQLLVARHETLRTSFGLDGETPIQIIAPELTLSCPLVDLSDQSPHDRTAQVRSVLETATNQPFDLQHGPLIRATLVRSEPQNHVLLLVLHHIIADGWSQGVLVRELFACYEALISDRPPVLPPLAVQYADVAVWQRTAQAAALEQDLAYWQRQLAAPTSLALPTDHPRQAVQSLRGGSYETTLPPAVIADLKALSQAEGATLYMTLLAAFNVLLHRYTDQTDLLVGTPVANRNRTEINDLIGFFVNTLVIRSDLSGEPSFRELLRRVRATTLDALAHAEAPFAKVVEVVQPERTTSHSPLFQVMFMLQNVPMPPLELAHLTVSLAHIETSASQFDLTLEMSEQLLRLTYDRELFEPATIARLAEHLLVLLHAIAATPDARIASLPMAPANERALLDQWNSTAVTYPPAPLPLMIAAQAARTPNAVAVMDGSQNLSYAELDQRSNQVAAYLQSLGVRADVRVAVCMERTPALITVLLGILKAGGAYIPLDPNYPSERIAYVLADAAAPLLITNGPLAAHLPPHSGQTMVLDQAWPAINAAPACPLPAIDPEQLAYVIYTSGSTGRPKGVAVRHAGLRNLMHAMQARIALSAADRFAALTTVAFDIAVIELFLPLVLGARTVITTRAVATNGQALAELLSANGVTVLQATPTTYQLLLEAAPAIFASDHLRLLLIGGEALPRSLAETLLQYAPQLWNLYGPTETTVWSSGSHVIAPDTITLGQPLANTQFYVLDRHLTAVPLGAVGELYIGGAGLARGYLGRPALTASAFVPHPWSAEPGARLYKTGDLVRQRPDGMVEFLGRVDHQVKIRGYRIELGEIENVLMQHPVVTSAAVLVHAVRPDDLRLVAYVVAGPLDLAELRSWVQSHLPEYMVPNAFALLDVLPLTPNGKIDRRRLAASNAPLVEPTVDAVGPRTPDEEVLAGIWADLLNLPHVSVAADFFSLGGHSLLATRLLGRIRAVFDLELPLRALFEAPTVAGLAERIAIARRADQGLDTVPLRANLQTADLPLSFAQQRLWFLDQIDPGSPTYNLPLPLRLHGSLNLTALHQALDAIVARQSALRTIFVTSDGQPTQSLLPPAPVAVPAVDLTHLPASEREAAARQLVLAEAQRPFDLAAGPLLRALLLRLDSEDHVLLITTHHIVFDGSQGIFLREWAALYNAAATGTTAHLPPLAVQQPDVAAWQRAALQGSVLETQLDYWRNQLGGHHAPLQLPTDRPRPALQTANGTKQIVILSQPLTKALTTLSRAEGATLFMTMLAGFQALLQRYSGQDQIAVGTPVSQRSHAETEHLIGCFVNTLVLRTDLGGNPSFRELIGRVRTVALGAYAHQDIPFEMLVETLQPERDPSRNPLYQAMFVLQHAAAQQPSLHDLRLSSFEIANATARFDLLLALTERDEQLMGMIEYNTDLFDDQTITRMLSHFETLLTAAALQPNTPISLLPIVPPTEQHHMLQDWNATALPYEANVCLHQLFERQAARQPEALALVCGDTTLSYAALNEWANQIAAQLVALGVGPGVMVAVWLERTPALIPTLLGILKAGGTYIPLEPSFPTARVAWIVANLNVPCIVTQHSLAPRVAELEANAPDLAHVVCVDPAAPAELAASAAIFAPTPLQLWTHLQIAAQPTTNLAPRATANDLAYIIFTSGSTGTPKGVMVRHQPVINLIEWVNTSFMVGPADQVLFVTSVCFDLSVYDIFGLLAAGGSIRVVNEQELRDPERLLGILCHEPITFWDSAPAALQQLTAFFPAMLDHAARSHLRLVFLSGDWIPVPLPDHVRSTFPKAQVISLGGATEATVWSNFYPIEVVEPHWTSIPYGKPIQNARYYILDRALQPVPIGVAGELHIGGECLASGYANDPALTASKFIADPFNATPGAVMYRTGDQARFWPDGTIEFLGRIDHQVKIRGFRIELGEIETVLNTHPDVREGLVLAREDTPGEKRLVAYVVARADQAPSTAELRAWLRDKLPEYMLPAAFVALDAIPLTANGKVDRKALPAPVADRTASNQELVTPRTPAEQILATVWAEVLRIEQVGIYDNFFALGGDSILVIQVIARANQQGLRLAPRDLFQHQTIAELAACAGQAPTISASQELITGAVPLTPIQHWFFAQPLPAPQHWNQALLLQVHTPLDPDLLRQAIAQLLRHHDALRLRFSPSDTAYTQTGVLPDDDIPCTTLDWAALAPAEQSAALSTAINGAQASLDLAQGPLMRAVYCDFGRAQPGRLLLVIHHLAVDGVSWRVLLEDLETVYRQLAQGMTPALPPKTSAFQQWATRLAEYAQSPTVINELTYWREQPWSAVRPVPVDEWAGENREADSRSVVRQLSAEDTRRLLQDVPAAYHTQINEVLILALALAYAEWSEERVLLLALEGHGREALFEDLDIGRTVGWFTAIYPVLLDLGSDTAPGAVLQAIKAQLRAIPQRGLGYGLLRYLHPDSAVQAELAALPQPEISFNYLGQFDQAFQADGLFSPATEAVGAVHAPEGPRPYLLDVSGGVVHDQLQLVITYGSAFFRPASIEALADALVAALDQLIHEEHSFGTASYIPSDFPLAQINQQQLTSLLAKFNKRTE